MRKRSKRYKKLSELVKNNKKPDSVEKVIDSVKANSNSKFVESVDVSFKLNLKKIKGSETTLRTVIELPNGNGKKIRVGVLCDESKLNEAKKSGADIVGSEDLLKKISSGTIEFDKLIATPSMMGKMGKLGKILGTKGLMPNPKLGTVSDDITNTVKKVKSKLIEVKNDKDGNVGVSIGRKSFTTKQIQENLKVLFQTLKKEKSSIINSEIVKNAYISSTMSPSYKISIKDI